MAAFGCRSANRRNTLWLVGPISKLTNAASTGLSPDAVTVAANRFRESSTSEAATSMLTFASPTGATDVTSCRTVE